MEGSHARTRRSFRLPRQRRARLRGSRGLRLWLVDKRRLDGASIRTLRRAGLRRSLALLLVWALTAELVVVTLVTSSSLARADSSDMLLLTNPAPDGFHEVRGCNDPSAGTANDVFDGDDATFCASGHVTTDF